jgi:hypothetical protein
MRAITLKKFVAKPKERCRGGFLKLPRNFLESCIWKDFSSAWTKIFITILAMAEFKPRKTMWLGKWETLREGEVVTSMSALVAAAGLGASEHMVRNALEWLAKLGTLCLTPSPMGTRITLLKWGKYQVEKYDGRGFAMIKREFILGTEWQNLAPKDCAKLLKKALATGKSGRAKGEPVTNDGQTGTVKSQENQGFSRPEESYTKNILNTEQAAMAASLSSIQLNVSNDETTKAAKNLSQGDRELIERLKMPVEEWLERTKKHGENQVRCVMTKLLVHCGKKGTQKYRLPSVREKWLATEKNEYNIAETKGAPEPTEPTTEDLRQMVLKMEDRGVFEHASFMVRRGYIPRTWDLDRAVNFCIVHEIQSPLLSGISPGDLEKRRSAIFADLEQEGRVIHELRSSCLYIAGETYRAAMALPGADQANPSIPEEIEREAVARLENCGFMQGIIAKYRDLRLAMAHDIIAERTGSEKRIFARLVTPPNGAVERKLA